MQALEWVGDLIAPISDSSLRWGCIFPKLVSGFISLSRFAEIANPETIKWELKRLGTPLKAVRRKKHSRQ